MLDPLLHGRMLHLLLFIAASHCFGWFAAPGQAVADLPGGIRRHMPKLDGIDIRPQPEIIIERFQHGFVPIAFGEHIRAGSDEMLLMNRGIRRYDRRRRRCQEAAEQRVRALQHNPDGKRVQAVHRIDILRQPSIGAVRRINRSRLNFTSPLASGRR